MKASIEISDKELNIFFLESIKETLKQMDVEKTIQILLNKKVDEILKSKLSDEKIDNFGRDRVSRIITTESLQDFTLGLQPSDVLSNLESKILLMIKNSTEFKKLVKSVLKDSL